MTAPSDAVETVPYLRDDEKSLFLAGIYVIPELHNQDS
jgi:hypothetical protein